MTAADPKLVRSAATVSTGSQSRRRPVFSLSLFSLPLLRSRPAPNLRRAWWDLVTPYGSTAYCTCVEIIRHCQPCEHLSSPLSILCRQEPKTCAAACPQTHDEQVSKASRRLEQMQSVRRTPYVATGLRTQGACKCTGGISRDKCLSKIMCPRGIMTKLSLGKFRCANSSRLACPVLVARQPQASLRHP